MRLIGFLLLFSTVAAVPVLASDAAEEREETLESIDDLMSDMLRRLQGFETDRNADDLRYVQRHIAKLESEIRDLGRVAKGNDDAEHIVRGWPRIIDQFEASIKLMAAMKQRQFELDKLPQECRKKERELAGEITEILREKDFDDADELVELAQELGEPILETLKDGKAMLRELAKARDKVVGFSGQQDKTKRWRQIDEKIGAISKKMALYYAQHYREAVDKCEDLARAEKHGAVVRALQLLDRHADDHETVMADLTAMLRKIETELPQYAGEPHNQRAKNALAVTRLMGRRLDALKANPGEDEVARDRLRHWPEDIKSFERALRVLATIKKNQFAFDLLQRNCKAATNRLTARLKNYDGLLEDLPEIGRRIGEPIDEDMKEAEALFARLRSVRRDATFRVRSSEWQQVARLTAEAAEAMEAYAEGKLTLAQKICTNLRLKDKHPRIVDAEKALKDKIAAKMKETAAARQASMDELDDHVEEIEAKLKLVAGRRDASTEIRAILNATESIETELRKLRPLASEDPKAIERESDWPDLIVPFQSAVHFLRQMKEKQYENDGLEAACGDADRQLRESADSYRSDSNLAEVGDLIALADRMGAQAARQLADARAVAQAVARARSGVERFGSGSHWQKIESALFDAGREVDEHVQEAFDRGKKACAELVKGDGHEQVADAVDELRAAGNERQRLMSDLRRWLSGIAYDLADFPRQKDAQGLTRVLDAAERIEQGLRDLAPISGGDRQADARLAEWPDDLDDLKAAVDVLAGMKRRQFEADPLHKECIAATAKVNGRVTYWKGRKYPRGITVFPEEVADLGRPIVPKLAAADALAAWMRGELAKAKRFSPSREWSNVATAVDDAADGVHQHVEDTVAGEHRVCDELAKLKGHKKVQEVIDELTKVQFQRIGAFGQEMNDWIEDLARPVYRLECKGMKEMWQAFCGLDYEPDDDPPSPNMRAAQRLRDQRVLETENAAAKADGEYWKLLAEYADLKDPTQPPDVQEMYAKILKKASGYVEKFEDVEAEMNKLKSSNNPIMQFAARYGVQKHNDMGRSSGCFLADITFEHGRGGTRPDCVKPNGCKILEFKPNNDRAVDAGDEQLDGYPGYLEQATTYYEKFLPISAGNFPDDKLGGEKIMLEFERYGCIKGGRLDLDGEVVTYEMCASPFKCRDPD